MGKCERTESRDRRETQGSSVGTDVGGWSGRTDASNMYPSHPIFLVICHHSDNTAAVSSLQSFNLRLVSRRSPRTRRERALTHDFGGRSAPDVAEWEGGMIRDHPRQHARLARAGRMHAENVARRQPTAESRPPDDTSRDCVERIDAPHVNYLRRQPHCSDASQ
jgi:hypothetical protein